MNIVPSALVRNTIADFMLPAGEVSNGHLGAIQLHAHQVDGVERIMRSLHSFRGAILCDEVGLGKTFTAAGVIRRFTSSVVVAPAALIPMWTDALQHARIRATLLSTEKFSRAKIPPSGGADLIVVDEAHHFRNIRTKRFTNLSRFIGNGRTLLLTATPVHNSRSDIVALLSLFVGSRANSLTPSELGDCVIRREKRIIGDTFPRRVLLPAEVVPSSEAIRSAILSLPPPIPPSDGDECSTLVQFTLLRQWASSEAALRAGLANRIARARALLQALEAGTYPSREELHAWLIGGETDIQLGFPEFLAGVGGAPELITAVRKHEEETLKIYHLVRSDADEWRAEYLVGLRTKYPDRKIIAFTQFASTARHLFSLIRGLPGTALITAKRCEIASGPVPREFVIERFAPIANRCELPPTRESVSLLVATDLCSEGLNLQDATVLVHLDTPWTPARAEQRVGRIARPGGPNPEIFVHSITAPAITDDILGMGERLRQKSAATASAVGRDAFDTSPVAPPLSVPEASEAITRRIASWKSDQLVEGPATPIAAEVIASTDCFIAVVTNGQAISLLSGSGEQLSNDPRAIISHIDALSADDTLSDDKRIASTVEAIRGWLQQKSLEDSLGVRRNQASGRRRIARRIGFVASSFPPHLRVAASMLADAARDAVLADCNAGGEEGISLLEQSVETGDAWLREVVEVSRSFGSRKAEPTSEFGFEVLALLMGRRR